MLEFGLSGIRLAIELTEQAFNNRSILRAYILGWF